MCCTQELDDREKFLEALLEKYQAAPPPAAATISGGPPLPQEEAVAIILRNERGRQAREKAAMMLMLKRQRQLEDRRSKLGVALGHDEAVTRIQSVIRGFIWRMRVRREADHEQAFIGMRPLVRAEAV